MSTGSVGETTSDVVYTENKLELIHYEPRTEQQRDVPVLLVYAIIDIENHRPIESTINSIHVSDDVIRRFVPTQ